MVWGLWSTAAVDERPQTGRAKVPGFRSRDSGDSRGFSVRAGGVDSDMVGSEVVPLIVGRSLWGLWSTVPVDERPQSVRKTEFGLYWFRFDVALRRKAGLGGFGAPLRLMSAPILRWSCVDWAEGFVDARDQTFPSTADVMSAGSADHSNQARAPVS